MLDCSSSRVVRRKRNTILMECVDFKHKTLKVKIFSPSCEKKQSRVSFGKTAGLLRFLCKSIFNAAVWNVFSASVNREAHSWLRCSRDVRLRQGDAALKSFWIKNLSLLPTASHHFSNYKVFETINIPFYFWQATGTMSLKQSRFIHFCFSLWMMIIDPNILMPRKFKRPSA